MNKLLLLAISMMFAGNAACTDSLTVDPNKDDGATKASSVKLPPLPELPTITTVDNEESDWVKEEKASFRRQIAIAKDQIYKCMHSYYREDEIKAMGYYDEYDMVEKLERKINLLERLLAID